MMVSHYPYVQFLAVMAMVGWISFSSFGRVHAQSAGLPTTIYALNTTTTISGESHISILIIKVPLPSGSNSTVMVTSSSRFEADTGNQLGSLTGVGSATTSATSTKGSGVDGNRYMLSEDNEDNVQGNLNISFSAAQFNGNDGSTSSLAIGIMDHNVEQSTANISSQFGRVIGVSTYGGGQYPFIACGVLDDTHEMVLYLTDSFGSEFQPLARTSLKSAQGGYYNVTEFEFDASNNTAYFLGTSTWYAEPNQYAVGYLPVPSSSSFSSQSSAPIAALPVWNSLMLSGNPSSIAGFWWDPVWSALISVCQMWDTAPTGPYVSHVCTIAPYAPAGLDIGTAISPGNYSSSRIFFDPVPRIVYALSDAYVLSAAPMNNGPATLNVQLGGVDPEHENVFNLFAFH